jgi:glycine/D-amino acid oxidase-like deaminating enzyme
MIMLMSGEDGGGELTPAPHNGDVSFWWRARGGFPPRRPSLPGPADADVCIVGAGFTGLWTAYYLKQADPALRIVVLEAAFAGFGASGRNGGWLTSALPGSRERYARGPGGRAAVLDLQRQLRETVDEVARVCAAEGIDADLVKGGELEVATTPAQHERLRGELADHRQWGMGEEDVAYLGPAELSGRVRIAGALGALYIPQSARVQPAKLVAGLADAVQRAGVQIYEATPVTRIVPRAPHQPDSAGPGAARACTVFGDVTARYVLRATEGFTTQLPGQRRSLLPMNSSMIVTEPLTDEAWREIGWAGRETIGDSAHVYMYAQRTADGRIAIGGRGIPYRFGSALDQRGTTQPETIQTLRQILYKLFPAAGGARIDHAWCGVLGVPRDWCATVTLDADAGLGWAGGYTGHGVAASNLAGRTLADLVMGATTSRTTLPWVGHHTRRWEPEPLRWVGVHGLYALYRAADSAEDNGSPRTSRLARIGDRISGIP